MPPAGGDEMNMTQTDPLAALRREIDRLDDAMLGLVEQRVAAAREIAELKRNEADSRLRLRPAREAAVVERLVGQAGTSPEKLVRQVWREIMACCLDLQVHTDLIVHAEQRPAALTDAMRRRFGCAGKMIVIPTPDEALATAREREAIAVIELQPDSSWWAQLQGDPKLAIFDCLQDDEGRIIALAIGRIAEEDLRACPQVRIVEDAAAGEVLAASNGVALVLTSGGAAA
jgi:chorismate mutase